MRSTCFLFLVSFQIVCAQYTKDLDSIPLPDVLRQLETIHNVKFSYNPEKIGQKQISLTLDQLTLEESIKAIESASRIIFDKIDNRYYTVKKQTKNIFICGYITDQENGSPIQGVNIINTTTKQGTVSNEQGYFNIEDNSDSDMIVLSFLGFKRLALSIDQISAKECHSFTLVPSSYTLEGVVVHEYLGAGIVKMKDGAINIDPNNLDILSGLSEPDILQNIQLLPGIESPGETASGLYIRGGTPDQNLILWDGIKMYNSNHFFGMISAFNPYVVNDVSVVRSGTNPKYGDRISGVIDIRTENNIPENFEGQVGINTLFSDINIRVPLSKKIGLQVSGRRSLIELFRSPTFNTFAQKVFQNTNIDPLSGRDQDFEEEEGLFNFHDFNFKSIFNLSPVDKLTISGLKTRNNLDFSLISNNPEAVSTDRLNITNWGSSVSWSRFWNDDLKSEVKAYYSNHTFNYSGQNPFLNQELNTTKNNAIKEIGFSSHWDWSINSVFSLSGGYQFFSNQVTYALANNGIGASDDTTGRSHSIYGRLKFEENEHWNIGLGIRSNYYSSLRSIFVEPRIYVEHILNKNVRLKASAEIRNQAVSQIVEFFTVDFGLENQVWALAKEDEIPLLRSDQLSLGWLFSLENSWHIDIDAYYKNIDGFTTFTRGFESFGEDLSEGNSRIRGIDVLIKKKMGNYSSWLGYTYSTTDFLFEELNQGNRFRGNNDIRHSLTWSHFYKWNKFQLSLGWKYRTGIPYTQAKGIISDTDDFFVDYDVPNSKTFPDYHRLDFSILYDFKLDKKDNGMAAKLGFSLLNVYARENILNRNYGIFLETDSNGNTSDAVLRQIDRFSLGITPNFFFRVKF